MRTIFTMVTCLLCLGIHAQRTKKAIFIIADGIPADVMEAVPHPNLEKIASEGAYKRAFVGGGRNTYSQTPTISAVSYNSLLTGTWVNKHNVWDNDIRQPNYHYPTIFRLFRNQYPGRKMAVYSTWTDNRTKLVGEGLQQTGNIRMDHVSDGHELDTVRYPHDRQSYYIHLIDEKVAADAALSIKENAPDLSWVYLEYTDDMGHRFGNSEQLNKAVAAMDTQVGKIWDAIEWRRKQFNEDWLIFITTDHGRDSITGRGHGGQTARERATWLFTNAKGLNNYFRSGEPAVTDILPTIARHLDLQPTKDVLFELDGVPLTGNVAVAGLSAAASGDSIRLSWRSFGRDEKLKIWYTTTNRFKEGGQDQYILAGETKANRNGFTFKPAGSDRGFFKIVVETPSNTINTWIK